MQFEKNVQVSVVEHAPRKQCPSPDIWRPVKSLLQAYVHGIKYLLDEYMTTVNVFFSLSGHDIQVGRTRNALKNYSVNVDEPEQERVPGVDEAVTCLEIGSETNKAGTGSVWAKKKEKKVSLIWIQNFYGPCVSFNGNVLPGKSFVYRFTSFFCTLTILLAPNRTESVRHGTTESDPVRAAMVAVVLNFTINHYAHVTYTLTKNTDMSMNRL